MGTTLEITVYRPTSDRDQAAVDLEVAYQEILAVDQRFSLYRADSELVRLNAQSGQGNVAVSDEMLRILSASNYYSALSQSAFDIAIQPLVDLWGFYDVAEATVPSPDALAGVLSRVGRQHVSVDAVAGEVALTGGAGLDLGGIAKGYAVDLATAALRARGVPAALVNLGGNTGVLGLAPGDRPWVIGIRDPRNDRLISQVRLTQGAVSTSGDYDRYFEVEGKRYSHLLDPRTGRPVDGIYSLTVIAPTAMAADALSTAAFVLGAEEGMSLLSGCDRVEGLLIQPGSGSEDLTTIVTGSDSDTDSAFTLAAEGIRLAALDRPDFNAPRQDCVWPTGLDSGLRADEG